MSKTIVITGTSRGLGLEMVKQLSAKGHIIFACARNPDKSERLQSLVDGKRVHAITLDTVDPESAKAAAAAVEALAPNGIDILINNAGIMKTSQDVTVTDPLNAPLSEFQALFDTNVLGTMSVTRAFVPLLRKGSTRQIFNVTSLLGSLTSSSTSWDYDNPYCRGNLATYCISKAAENMLTRATSGQLAHENFTVVSLHPGWVKTDLGTDDAPVEIADSIKGLVNVIENTTSKDNGTFIDFEGNSVKW